MAILDFKYDIHKDTNVYGNNFYFGNGQGCGTLWFKTLQQVKDFIAEQGRISGHDSGFCEKCNHHYSFGTKEYKKYPPLACKEWKLKVTVLKTCKNCKHYPKSCGYWSKPFRKNNKSASFLSKDQWHNCQEFELK